MPADGTYVVDVLPSQILTGLGMGLSMPAMMTLAMSGATPQDAGLASGLINTTVQVGGAIGLAVLATIAAEPPAPRRPCRRCWTATTRRSRPPRRPWSWPRLLAFALTSSAVVLRVRDVLAPGRV